MKMLVSKKRLMRIAKVLVSSRGRMRVARGGWEEFVEEFGEEEAKAAVEAMGFEPEDVSSFQESRAGFRTEAYEVDFGSEEYIGFKDNDDAEEYAIEVVKQDLEEEPEIFSQDWLQSHVTITPTDKRILASEEADSVLESMSDDDILSESGYDSKKEELEEEYSELEDEISELEEEADELEEDDEDEDAANEAAEKRDEILGKESRMQEIQEELDGLVDEAREELSSSKAEEIESELDDPVQYFVEDQGAFSIEDLMKASFISIDTDAAAKEAVWTDGVAHFLAGYDGRKVDGNRSVWYRTN